MSRAAGLSPVLTSALLALAAAGPARLALAQGDGVTNPVAAIGSELGSIRQCWSVDADDPSGLISVTVGFDLDRSGRVLGEVRLLGDSGGDEAAVGRAFEAVRRAILRCQGDGFDLPPEHHDLWRRIEIVFDPREMTG